jgi:2-iminobutanoate/2-iminopropanoate deaminase
MFYSGGDDQGEETGIREGDTTGAISGVSGGVKAGDDQWSIWKSLPLEDGREERRGEAVMIDEKESLKEEDVPGGPLQERTVIHTDKAPAAIGPYSQAIRLGALVFTSGSLGLDAATGKLVEGGIEAQTKKALDNLSSILKAAGSDLSAVAKTTVFVSDLKNFPVVNKIYGEYFHHEPPARSTVEVAGLPMGALVEIEAIAAVTKKSHGSNALKHSSSL